MGTETAVTPEETTRAIQTIVARGHIYVTPTGYMSLKVFTKDYLLARLLRKVFGGNYYKQGTGVVWALGDTEDLAALAEVVRPHRTPHDNLCRLYDLVDSQA